MEKNIKRINLASGFIDYAIIKDRPVIFHYSATADRTILELLGELLKEKTLGGYDNQYFKDVTKETTTRGNTK